MINHDHNLNNYLGSTRPDYHENIKLQNESV